MYFLNLISITLSTQWTLLEKHGMNSAIDLIASLDAWALAEEGLGFNTNLLDTNLINLAVVIGVLVYFGKGVCAG
jgi:F-type H+-transporting ATPase subunit b